MHAEGPMGIACHQTREKNFQPFFSYSFFTLGICMIFVIKCAYDSMGFNCKFNKAYSNGHRATLLLSLGVERGEGNSL